MRYLLLLSLLFVGCTQPKTYTYECAALGRHGVFAKWTGNYTSEVDAKEQGEIIRKRLVEQKLIPDSTGTKCYLK